MFYDLTTQNCKKPFCFKIVYDVCVTPSYVDMPKYEEKDECKCHREVKNDYQNNGYNKEQNYYNAWNNDKFDNNKNNCKCCCRKWFW